jgi:L-lactate dehydrogenase complex protein LldE
VNVLKVERIKGARYQGRVAYHDSCSALRECGLYEEPRKLLRNVAGVELLDLPANQDCCGFGGTFAVKFEAISVGMAQQKVNNALSVGADTIVSTDSSCLLHLDAYIRREKLPIKTMHLADVLASED